VLAGDFEGAEDDDVESVVDLDESVEEVDFSEEELDASPLLELCELDDELELVLLELLAASRLSLR
jgi:hypothetical protein